MSDMLKVQSILSILDEMRGHIEELEIRASTDYLQRLESRLENAREHNTYLNSYANELEFILESIGVDINRTYLQWELDAMRQAIEKALR